LKCYTHFTSPIRRYFDILVHRDLYNSLNHPNTCIIKNIETIKRINECSKYYKKLQRHTKLLYKLELIGTIAEVDAYIVSLKSEHNYIRVYIEFLDLEIDIKIFDNKVRQIVENISENENELVIINTQTTIGVTLKLFQKISIQIVKTRNLFKPISTTIIEPNIQEILNLI
jgi:exoribonuclease R